MSKTVMIQITGSLYTSERTNPPTPGITLSREDSIGNWILRSGNGDVIDQDQYRNDIAERHNLKLRGND